MNENHPSAQYARRFVMALPRELSYEDNLRFVRQYCQEQFVAKGMCVDLAYHHDGDGNPHVHILTTMRAIDEQGRWMPKSRKEYILEEHGERIRLKSGEWKSRHVPTTDWDDHGNLEKWRHAWEVLQNQYLEDAGRPERIDMRSYERQGNDMIPTIHLGPEASAMERRGVHTFLGDINRDIQKQNRLIATVKKGITVLTFWVKEMKERQSRVEEQFHSHGPSVKELMADYVRIRMQERAGWSSKASIRGTSKDMVTVVQANDWLQANNIYYFSDMMKQLNALEQRSRTASDTLKKNDARRKLIAKIENQAQVIIDKKPIINTLYRKMGRDKEKYAAEHDEDIKESKRAYAFLMKNHDKKLEVKPDEFKAELQQMADADQAAIAELEKIQESLAMLRKIKRCIAKVDPELVQVTQEPREKPSLHAELAAA